MTQDLRGGCLQGRIRNARRPTHLALDVGQRLIGCGLLHLLELADHVGQKLPLLTSPEKIR